MEGSINITDSEEAGAKRKAFREIIVQMVQPDAYEIATESSQYRLKLKDKDDNPLGSHPELFASKAEAQEMLEELLAWSGNERAIVVEHLLLRPKFPGDALYPACSDGACKTCGDEDPYSFRMTIAMPGWTAPFNVNLDMRGFADRAIRKETPSHLLTKVCWVGNEGFIENPCDPIVGELAELLQNKGLTGGGVRPNDQEACTCAEAIYAAFSEAFKDWYDDKTLDFFQDDALKTALESEFNANVNPAGISCTTILDAALWGEVLELMLKYFHYVALYGWQFERFEDAWCKWLDANALIDWTEERLRERVEAILKSNLTDDLNSQSSSSEQICKCANEILTEYGMEFHTWMKDNLQAGNALEDFTTFSPNPIKPMSGSGLQG